MLSRTAWPNSSLRARSGASRNADSRPHRRSVGSLNPATTATRVAVGSQSNASTARP